MKKLLPLAAALLFTLTACGYKGDLYLPREDDKAKFGPLQTGLPLPAPEPTTQPER
ncbi:MAG: lipoprotein [Neisseria sp.]|uniref:LPS translocon maturation chaperone LptM n=1 Tax=Neisseria sp. TaxID=192066 RepID=UPI0026DD7BE7|nr:lipoprotein [Neisseria sp.]MDO4247749.1 lipoprotein [Neisseria sp.]